MRATDEYEPLDERYFVWLYSIVGTVNDVNPAHSHWELCRVLFRTPFRWYVRNDDNRAADGKALRNHFPGSYEASESWMNQECSMLEMLIALAERMGFEENRTTYDRFWHILDNIGLYRLTDSRWSSEAYYTATRAIEKVIDRTYASNGQGGLFPLRYPDQDQRNVELWYQMSAYVMENDDLYD